MSDLYATVNAPPPAPQSLAERRANRFKDACLLVHRSDPGKQMDYSVWSWREADVHAVNCRSGCILWRGDDYYESELSACEAVAFVVAMEGVEV